MSKIVYSYDERLKRVSKRLHRKITKFIKNVSIDPDELALNEYLRIENLILREMAFGPGTNNKFSREEKIQLANRIIEVKGRTGANISLLSPRQIKRYAHKEASKIYISLGPTKTPRKRMTLLDYQIELRNIIDAHPKWGKSYILREIRKTHPHADKRMIYDLLYNMGVWDCIPKRTKLTWKEFLARFEGVTWAGDFFTIDVWSREGLKVYYILFFIHLKTQRVVIAGITSDATEDWLIHILKSWTDAESPLGPDARFLIRDRDRLYTKNVDWYFARMGIMPKKISPATPVMNFHAEHFVRKIKSECLSHCTFFSVAALKKTINLYVNYYHHQRPNSKFNGGCIIEDQTQWHEDGIINQIESIPGLLNYYYRTPETQKV